MVWKKEIAYGLKFIVLYNRKEEGYNLKSIEMTRIILAENEKSRGLEQIC